MQKKTVSKDIPLADITLRKYERPENFNNRDLIKKFCLGLGLLQPGDSRDIVVDVFGVLLQAKEGLNSEELTKLIIEERKKYKLQLLGITPSNVRRQLKRLRAMFLIEKIANKYRLNENAKLSELFEEKIEKFLIPSITSRIKEYAKKIDARE